MNKKYILFCAPVAFICTLLCFIQGKACKESMLNDWGKKYILQAKPSSTLVNSQSLRKTCFNVFKDDLGET